MTAPVLTRATPHEARPAAPSTNRRGRRRIAPRFLVGLALGAAATAAVVGAAGLLGVGTGQAPSVEAQRAELLAYEEAIGGLIEQGGAVVVYGMRPGLGDIGDGRFADEVLVRMAEGWLGEMTRIRAEWRALETPSFLDPVASLFDDALAGYVRTAEALLAAARAERAERVELIERTAALGTEADGLFDAAKEALAGERARLGLPPDDNHTGGPR